MQAFYWFAGTTFDCLLQPRYERYYACQAVVTLVSRYVIALTRETTVAP